MTDELCSLEIKRNARFPFLSGVIRGAGELHFSLNGFITEIKHRNEKFVNLVADVLNDAIRYIQSLPEMRLLKKAVVMFDQAL